MKTFSLVTTASAALLLAACGGAPSTSDADTPTPATQVDGQTAEAPALIPELENVAAANYSLEKTHAFLTFKVGHAGGISQYRVNFTDFDADLAFDPADPEAAQLSVTINPLAVETNYNGDYKAGHANSGYETWNEDLARNPGWLNADAFPEISFASTSIERTGDKTGTVTGDMTFLGKTAPITFDVTFNGSANAPWFGTRDLIGFNASTVITRSEWGMTRGVPNIGDAVSVEFSGEFLQDE
ncbi:MAG: YceI family protein [Pseudomonadota bacterium]